VLDEVAKTHFKGRIKIGKVDATVHSGLKKRFDIKSFPTVEYFEDGEIAAQFTGGRDVDSIVMYGARMEQPLLRDFENYLEFERWLNHKSKERDTRLEPLSFVLLLPTGGQSSVGSSQEHAALEAVAKASRPFHLFAKSSNAKVWDYLCKDGPICEEAARRNGGHVLLKYEVGESPQVYPGENLGDEDAVSLWVKTNAVPVFPKMGLHNYQQLTSQEGKLVVLGAYDPDNAAASELFLDWVKSFAGASSPLAPAIRERLIFANIDGRKWAAYLQDFGLETAELPRILVVDFQGQVYFANQTLETAESLPELLRGAVDGTAPSYSLGWIVSVRRIWRSFMKNMPYSGLLTAAGLGVMGVFGYMLIWGDYDDDDFAIDAGADPAGGATVDGAGSKSTKSKNASGKGAGNSESKKRN